MWKYYIYTHVAYLFLFFELMLELVPHTTTLQRSKKYCQDSKEAVGSALKSCCRPSLCGSPLKHCTNSLKIAYVEFFINFDTNIWFLDLYLNFEKEKRYGCYSYLKFKITYHFLYYYLRVFFVWIFYFLVQKYPYTSMFK